jgi:hypothetical protein
MQYVIYQITNQLNGKIYIGAHATKDINDDYMGSGSALFRAKEKYGLENFTKEILHIFADEKSMYAKEKEIVTEEFCNSQNNYNLRTGGIGGWNHWNGTTAHTEASIRGGKASGNREGNPFKNPEWQMKYDWTRSPDQMKMMGERALDPKAKIKRKATLKEINHQQGEKNSQFGRYWISHPMTKEVKRITLNDTIPEGWVKGKKGFVPKMCWVNNRQVEHFIPIEKKQEYISKGYTSGRFESSMPQNRIVV